MRAIFRCYDDQSSSFNTDFSTFKGIKPESPCESGIILEIHTDEEIININLFDSNYLKKWTN